MITRPNIIKNNTFLFYLYSTVLEIQRTLDTSDNLTHKMTRSTCLSNYRPCLEEASRGFGHTLTEPMGGIRSLEFTLCGNSSEMCNHHSKGCKVLLWHLRQLFQLTHSLNGARRVRRCLIARAWGDKSGRQGFNVDIVFRCVPSLRTIYAAGAPVEPMGSATTSPDMQ